MEEKSKFYETTNKMHGHLHAMLNQWNASCK